MMMICLKKNVCPTKVRKELFLLTNIAKGSHHRSSHRRCSVKNGVPKKFCKIQRETPVLESLLIKLQDSGLQPY